MAKKTLVYEAQIRNGHGTNTELFVAPTKAILKKNIENDTVKVLGIRSLGQKTVTAYANHEESVSFKVKVNESSSLDIHPNDLGHRFLKTKFQPQFDKVKDDIAEIQYYEEHGYPEE